MAKPLTRRSLALCVLVLQACRAGPAPAAAAPCDGCGGGGDAVVGVWFVGSGGCSCIAIKAIIISSTRPGPSRGRIHPPVCLASHVPPCAHALPPHQPHHPHHHRRPFFSFVCLALVNHGTFWVVVEREGREGGRGGREEAREEEGDDV